MEPTGKLLCLLILFCVCVLNYDAYIINSKIEGVDKSLMNEIIDTKVNDKNLHLETSEHEVKINKDTINRRGVDGKIRATSSYNKIKHRDTVNRDTNTDSKRDENDIRVQIRYSIDIYEDDNYKSSGVPEKLDEDNGLNEDNVVSSSFAKAIIRINKVQEPNKNSDNIDEEHLHEANADNTTLPVKILSCVYKLIYINLWLV